MSTEASYRFERGVDPEGTLWVGRRAASLIQKLAGGTILRGYIDVYPKPISRPVVRARPEKMNQLLGLNLSANEMASQLRKLSITVEDDTASTGELRVIPPSWRWDLEREVDIAEEVARIHGFQNVPISMPTYSSAPDHTRENRNKIRRVNELMNASGFTEIITMSFLSRNAAEEFTRIPTEQLALVNPLTEDYGVMRTSLLPGLLSVMKRNMNFRCMDLKLYELGKIFKPVAGQELPQEDLTLGALATGARYPALWNTPRNEKVDFYDIKGALENLLEGLGVPEAEFVRTEIPFLHPGKSAAVIVEGQDIGFIGELSPAKCRKLDVNQEIYIFEILLEPLFTLMRKERVFTPLPRYPYIERDLSFIVEEKVSGDTIKRLISRLGHDIIASVNLFDLYRGESIPKGFQSMAFRIRYQSEDRTLTDEEVQEIHSQIVDTLTREVGATIRE